VTKRAPGPNSLGPVCPVPTVPSTARGTYKYVSLWSSARTQPPSRQPQQSYDPRRKKRVLQVVRTNDDSAGAAWAAGAAGAGAAAGAGTAYAAGGHSAELDYNGPELAHSAELDYQSPV
jgi:hypothetical protein